MRYNWQQPDWPNFRYDSKDLTELLLTFAEQSGRLSGLLEGLPDDLSSDAVIELMIAEAIRSSAIEGETLNHDAVMSSIRNHLGLNPTLQPVDSRLADGAGELMVAVRRNFRESLSAEILFSWHKMLLGGTTSLRVGDWREGGDAMQVVSGRIDRPTIHFEAPPAAKVPAEMKRFFSWFNATAPGGREAIPHAPIRSALAHLHFETIHPFEDGNGRLGRSLSEKALSQGLGHPVILSLSQTIDSHRSDYYDALKFAQRSNQVTPWLRWFLEMILEAQRDAEMRIQFVLRKSKYFQRYEPELSPRHLKVIRRMFDAGPQGFTGGMNARKYIALTGTSKATATRDLQQLTNLGALVPTGGGRSTRYELGSIRKP